MAACWEHKGLYPRPLVNRRYNGEGRWCSAASDGPEISAFGEALVKQIETAWAEPQPEWARQRLRVVRLIAKHELTAAEIMRVADESRQTVFTSRAP